MTALPKLPRKICSQCGDALCALLSPEKCREIDAPKCACGEPAHEDYAGCCSRECLAEAREP